MTISQTLVRSTSAPAVGNLGTKASTLADQRPPSVTVEDATDAPVREITSADLQKLGEHLNRLFMQYVSDRRILELRWLRNERQYLGVYDPEVEKELSTNRSKAYPRITRVKCISVLSRLMSLMFPGNERNWEIKASPNPDMDLDDIKQAIADAQKKDQESGQTPPMTMEYVQSAIQVLADKRADDLSKVIDDQLEELGGHQSLDYIGLNRAVVRAGIIYGIGMLEGPYAKPVKRTKWTVGPDGTPKPSVKTGYMPVFEFLKVWDFYPDLSAKTLKDMDGYFKRLVMSRSQVRALAERKDFFEDQIKTFLKDHQMGNYRPQPFETELRAMGVKVNVNEMKTETSKYEVIVWKGQTSGSFLQMAGCDIAPDKLADDLDAEVWMIEGNVIKCVLNPWKKLDVDVKMLHPFIFDEDDTSPVGFGLPNAIRDSQMSISAATRMLLDNASVVCGPNLEVNTDLLRPDQDLTSAAAYKVWYREGTGPDSQFPAVREIKIDAHLTELQGIIELFMKFADAETFVGPATGGDMDQMSSEPMRTAAGASMLRGDAALPFKDIVRSFDSFTQSVLDSLVQFNRKFNPDQAPEGDYNVIARGATSLIAKEVRGLQIDQLAATLTDDEKPYVDMKKMAYGRFAVRDMVDMLVSDEEAARRLAAQDQQNQQMQQQAAQLAEANLRKLLSDSLKNIAASQKNSAEADAVNAETALQILERGLQTAMGVAGGGQQQIGGAGADQTPVPDAGGAGLGPDAPPDQGPAGASQGGAGGMPPG